VRDEGHGVVGSLSGEKKRTINKEMKGNQYCGYMTVKHLA
jgi:hypothetical protein